MFPLFNAPCFLHTFLLWTHPPRLPVWKISTCSTSDPLHINQRQRAELKKFCGRGDLGGTVMDHPCCAGESPVKVVVQQVKRGK
jgi:hypothetical protein